MTIRIEGVVGWDATNASLVRQLPENKSEPVHVFVDSIGGDPFEGFAMFDTLSKRKNVSVEIGARAMSAASYIPFAADAGVTVNKTSTWMAHNAQSFSYGDKEDMRKTMDFLAGIDGIIANIYAEQLGLSVKDVVSKMDEEFWLFGGQAIIDAGIATGMSKRPEEGEGDDEGAVNAASMMKAFHEFMANAVNKRPDQPTDLKALNLILEDHMRRKETKVKNEQKTEEKKATPVEAKTTVENKVPVAPAAPAVPTIDVENVKRDERNRVMELLELSGVKVSNTVREAIENNMTQGDYAVAQLKANQAAAADNTGKVAVAPALDVSKQASRVENADKPADPIDAKVKKADALYDSWYKKDDK